MWKQAILPLQNEEALSKTLSANSFRRPPSPVAWHGQVHTTCQLVHSSTNKAYLQWGGSCIMMSWMKDRRRRVRLPSTSSTRDSSGVSWLYSKWFWNSGSRTGSQNEFIQKKTSRIDIGGGGGGGGEHLAEIRRWETLALPLALIVFVLYTVIVVISTIDAY